MTLLRVENLRKTFRVPVKGEPWYKRLAAPSFDTKVALNNVTFSVEEGQSVAYIGANGSGKSTTIKCLTGVLIPDSGTVSIAEMTPWKDRMRYVPKIGVLFGQKSLLFMDNTVQDALDLYKDIYGISDGDFQHKLREFNEYFETDRLLPLQVRKLSLGERMRCELMAALIHSPKILFLDEPTIGFDVLARDQFHRFLKKYQREYGITLFLTTHQVSDIEELCERVILLRNGAVIYQGRTTDLKQRFGNQQVIKVRYTCVLDEAVIREIACTVAVFEHDAANREARLTIDLNTANVGDLYHLIGRAFAIQTISSNEPPLEKVLVDAFKNELAFAA